MSIDDFISQFCPHVNRVRCEWHIINRGWKTHLPNIKRIKKHDKGPYDINVTAGGVFADTDAARILIPRIKECLYSFCKGDCPTKDRYIVSKNLL